MATAGSRGALTSRGIELVAIGTELLLGATVDTNGSWLGQCLAAAGIPVVRRATVGDDEAAIRSAVSDALGRTGAVICTGGLGPTRDDLTRPAVAAVFGRELVLHDEWLEVVRDRFRRRGIEMPGFNRVQAEILRGATVFPNDRGTAPGIAVEDEALGIAVLLPGVPREMQWLMEHHVLPFLTERGLSRGTPVVSRTLRTTGISESALAERIDDLVPGLAPLTLAYLPSGTGEDLRFTSWGELSRGDAERSLDAAVARFRERLGTFVYGLEDDDLADLLGAELRARNLTLALAESCTGGLAAKRMTDAPGASGYVLAGVVAYSDEAKRRLLGVRDETLRTHGAVSEATVLEMAQGARVVSGATCAIAITGVAGPGGGTEDKPVGTVWIAAATPGGSWAKLLRLFGDRSEIRERAAQAALALLRHRILKEAT